MKTTSSPDTYPVSRTQRKLARILTAGLSSTRATQRADAARVIQTLAAFGGRIAAAQTADGRTYYRNTISA